MSCTFFDKIFKKNKSKDDGDYTSYWYYSYEAVEQIGHEMLGLASVDDFNPYAVAQAGDTLFVSNVAGTPSVVVFDIRNNRPLSTVSQWSVNGSRAGFGSRIEAIVPTSERLYVVEQASRIHVFSLPALEYITCIGNGRWQGQVFQAQALTVYDGLIFARDKDGKVSVYKESDATAANYQNVTRYKYTNTYSSNNGFNPHYMAIAADSTIWLTDYEAMEIRVLDPSAVNDGMANGTSIDIPSRKLSIAGFKPRTFAVNEERLYVTGNNNSLNVYDFERKEWVKTLKSVKGFAFSNPERVYSAEEGVLWVSDINNKILVKVGVFKGEIREYTKISEQIVRVEPPLLSYGDTPEAFYVNVLTHEIVDPFE